MLCLKKGKKIMGEDPQSLENHGFPQISRLVLHSIKSLEIKGLTVVRNYKSCGGAENGVTGEGPDVKFCVSVFRQSQEWRWKTGRILAWIP